MRLDAAFARVSILPEHEAQARSDFACYLCILVSGFVEAAVVEIAAEHCRTRSTVTVMNYVAKRLERAGVFNAERLLQFVGSFSKEWREELAAFIAGKRKDALDSVVANRNQIAHGESVNLTLTGIRDYYASICEVIEFVADMFSTDHPVDNRIRRDRGRAHA